METRWSTTPLLSLVLPLGTSLGSDAFSCLDLCVYVFSTMITLRDLQHRPLLLDS